MPDTTTKLRLAGVTRPQARELRSVARSGSGTGVVGCPAVMRRIRAAGLIEWTGNALGEQRLTATGVEALRILDGRTDDRQPYVGAGADGARRSAEIDRTEADGLDRTDPRHALLLESAARWEAQAAELEPHVGPRVEQPVERPVRFAIDADCPGCGYPERSFDPARGVFACSSLNRNRCDYESTERDA